MTLDELGLTPWLRDQARAVCGPGESIARVTTVDREHYMVRNADREVPAELKGRLLHDSLSPADLPCVGDWVGVTYHDSGEHATIHRTLPRTSFLRRKAPGRTVDYQMIAAHIDVALIVQACHFDFNLARLERYLVMVGEGHIEPLIVLTKTDLVSPETLAALVAKIRAAGIGARVIALSTVTGDGMAPIRELLHPGKTYCLLGSSGVGKTTLINLLLGTATLETRPVSLSGEGRHTTTRRQLFVLETGGLLVDMPGMRELGLLGVADDLGESFGDVAALAQACRFADCTHTGEPGCAVQRAVELGEVQAGHLHNYQKLKKEVEFHELSYADKRKKDRAFGKMVQSAVRTKGKRSGE